MQALIEVRLLGPAMVRTADGQQVRHDQWKTLKNRDLLRLLAINHGVVVPVEQVVDALWPNAEPDKGRTSLRTAIAHLRRTIGPEVVERVGEGLRLGPAWVDLAVYESRVARAQRHFADGDVLAGLVAAKEAVALHVGELQADDPFAEWAMAARNDVERRHARLLAEATDAALGADLVSVALEFGSMALRHDRCAERPGRAVMTACARRGDTASALRVFQELRDALADELGVAPAPETLALQARILAGHEPLDAATDSRAGTLRAGMRDEQELLVSRLTAARDEGRGHLAIVVGEDDVGVSALLAQTAAALRPSTSVVELTTRGGIEMIPIEAGSGLGVLVVNGVEHPGNEELMALTARVVAHPPTLLVVGLSAAAATTGTEADATFVVACPDVTVVSLESSVGDARDRVHFLDADTVLWNRVERARAALDADEQEVVDLLAVSAAPLSASALARLSLDLPTIDGCLRALAKLDGSGLLRNGADGYRLAPNVAELAAAWIRPARLSALHARIAADAQLPVDLRARHLLASGEPEAAADLFLTAATAAARRGRADRVQRLLWDARNAVVQAQLPDRDAATWLRRVADVAAATGRTDDALDSLSAAVRLLREDEGRRGVRALPVVRSRPAPAADDRRRRPPAGAGHGDASASLIEVRARLLVTRLWPERNLEAVHGVIEELDGLAGEGIDQRTQAFAHLARIEGTVWTGGGAAHLRRLSGLAAELEHDQDRLVALRAALLFGWALHELDDPRWPEWWERTEHLATSADRQPEWRALSLLIAAERGERSRLEPISPGDWAAGRLEVPVTVLGLARSQQRQGRRSAAMETLSAALVSARKAHRLLLVPEIAARLAVLEAPDSPVAAASHLALAQSVGGQGQWFPRERAWILLAEAALCHVNGDVDAAEDLAVRAEVSAASAGLVWERRAITETVAGWNGAEVTGRNEARPTDLQWIAR